VAKTSGVDRLADERAGGIDAQGDGVGLRSQLAVVVRDLDGSATAEAR
jgi:hypothetical protein